MNIGVFEYGMVLTAIGTGLVLWNQKRKFDRTNRYGVEQFRSFGRKVVATAFDEILSWVAIGSLVVGLFILTFS